MDVGTQRELLALLRVIARAQVVIAECQSLQCKEDGEPHHLLLSEAASAMDDAVLDLDNLEEERREEGSRG